MRWQIHGVDTDRTTTRRVLRNPDIALLCVLVCPELLNFRYCYDSGGAVVLWLARWTSDLEVGILCRRVASLDKKLYSTLSLFTQVYRWACAIIILGPGNLAMDYHPIQRGVAVFLVAS